MILRRLTKDVNDQNWFAVALDFCIVVAGILIAFQITNWSTGRADRRVYDEAFERVVVELNRNLDLQDRVRRNIAEELPVIQRALDDLRACRADDAALDTVNAAMVPLNSPYQMLFETAALQQFLSNDAFLQYQSPEARQQLTELFRVASIFLDYDRARGGQMVRTNASTPDSLSLGPLAVSGPDDILKVMLSDSPLSPPLHREIIITVPLEDACKDKAFVADFYDWEAAAFQNSIIAGLMQPRLHEALDVLGRPVESVEGETP